MIGLDTSAIIDLFKGDESIKEFFLKNEEPLAFSIVPYAELQFGIAPNRFQEEEVFYDELVSRTSFVNLSRDACKQASKMYWRSKGNGREIGKFDCLIAASYVEAGVDRILTRNKNYFDSIEGITPVSY